jgi:hypothetical protein
VTREGEEEEEEDCKERREQLVNVRNVQNENSEMKSTSVGVRRRYRHAESSEKATTSLTTHAETSRKTRDRAGTRIEWKFRERWF